MENKEEKLEGGPLRRETIHNQHRRSYWHDYHEKGLYMVTMVIEGRKRLFGRLEGNSKGRTGTSDAPHLVFSLLGRRVLEDEVAKISRYYPMVEVWRVAMMPDHIHLLLYVREKLPEGKHLGMVVRGFKTGCSRAWWQWQDEQTGEGLGGNTPSTAAGSMTVGNTAAGNMTAVVPKVSPLVKERRLRPVLFEKGYHDRIINRPGMLENIKRYMAENPLRAMIRQECPHLMERQLHLWIAGREYAGFGNLFLLKYPIKEQVFFHRKDPKTGQPTETTDSYRQDHARLLRMAEEGTVLVTPGVSKGEQIVVNDALERHLPLLLLQKEPIDEYWKPSQRRFYACAEGRLLILAPWQVDGSSDYASFHQLNDMAHEICETTEVRIVNYSKLQSYLK